MQFEPELRSRWGTAASSFTNYGLSVSQVRLHADNLMRLRLVTGATVHPEAEWRQLVMTAYGRAFVRACLPPGQPDPNVTFTAETMAKAPRVDGDVELIRPPE